MATTRLYPCSHAHSPERMHGLRAGPAGAHDVGILGAVPLGQVVGSRDGRDVDHLLAGADRRDRVSGRGQHAADEQVDLVLPRQLFGLEHARRRSRLVVLEDELHLQSAEVTLDLFGVHLPAVDHVLADLGERAGHRCDEADAQLLLRRRGCRTQRHPECETCPDQYRTGSSCQLACHRSHSLFGRSTFTAARAPIASLVPARMPVCAIGE